MEIKDSFDEIFQQLDRVLVVLAHPDDIEINCGGLIARLTENGKKVRLVVVTNGGKGMKDKKGLKESTFATKRVAEQMKAGLILGVPKNENFNLQVPDGELESSVENIQQTVYHIREFKPELVITHNPQDFLINFFNKGGWVNHRDHRNTGQIVVDAVYPYSRDRGFFSRQFEVNKLSTHTVRKILLTDSYEKNTIKYFGIDKYMETKKKALQQHLSAFDPNEADDYLEENNIEGRYYEPLGYYEVY